MLRPTAMNVIPNDDYTLSITFDNAEKRKLDIKPFIKGDWYGKLTDLEYFKQVTTDGFTIVWPDGQDLCPDEVYALSENVFE